MECDNCSRAAHNPDQRDSDSDGYIWKHMWQLSQHLQRNRDFDTMGDTCNNCSNKYTSSGKDQERDGVGDPYDNCLFFCKSEEKARDTDFVGYFCEADMQGHRQERSVTIQ